MRAPYLIVCISYTLIYFQNMSVGLYVPSEGTYNYRYFFAQERKEPFKLPSRATFAIANINSHICLKFLSLRENFNFFREFVRCRQLQSA